MIKIKKSTIINFLNICVMLNYTTGLTDLYKVGLGLFNKMFNVITYTMLLFSTIYLIKKIYNNRALFIKYSWTLLFFVFTISIFSMISSKIDSFVLGKSIELVLTATYSIYLITYYEFEKLINIILKSQMIITIITIIFSMIYPQQANMYYEGDIALRGAYIHKNLLAANMAFGMLVSLVSLRYETNRKIKPLILLHLMVSLILILNAKSMTSLLIVVICMLLNMVYQNNKVKLNPTVVMFIIYSFIYYILFYSKSIQAWFEEVFNRSITLTGRVDIWSNVIDVLLGNINLGYNRLIGYGFQNTWREGSMLQEYMRMKTFNTLTGAHNGFLEWSLDIGLLGVLILIVLLIIQGHRILKTRKIFKIESSFIIMYIFYILIFYITERSTEPLGYQVMILFLTIVLTNKIYIQLKNEI